MPGLLRLNIVYRDKESKLISCAEQAKAILENALKIINEDKTADSIALIFSANHSQNCDVRQSYLSGKSTVGIIGNNQAGVVQDMQELLQTDDRYKPLCGKVHVLPISTCLRLGGVGSVSTAIVVDCLANIACYLGSRRYTPSSTAITAPATRWQVFGWMNQDSKEDFAIGGSISKELTQEQQDLIQAVLHAFEDEDFGESGYQPSELIAKIYSGLQSAYNQGKTTGDPLQYSRENPPPSMPAASTSTPQFFTPKKKDDPTSLFYFSVLEGKQTDTTEIPDLSDLLPDNDDKDNSLAPTPSVSPSSPGVKDSQSQRFTIGLGGDNNKKRKPEEDQASEKTPADESQQKKLQAFFG